MQNEETTNDVQVETKENETEETVEDSESEETTEESQSEESEESEELTIEERLAMAEAKATKAEAEAAKFRRLFQKTQKQPTKKVDEVKPQTSSPSSIEETVLKANGMPDELLKKLKKVAEVNGTSLLDAQKDELFVAFKAKFEKEEKEKKASLGASRGSGRTSAKVDINTPGLTREQHMELWKQGQ